MRHWSEVFEERSLFDEGHNLRLGLVRDPIDYTRATPDLKNHGQAMRSPMQKEWIKRQSLKDVRRLESRSLSEEFVHMSHS